MELKIEYLPIEEIKPYAGNAKRHPAEQIEQIKNSIKEFGFDDPIAIWNGEIVEGHGRYIAANEMGIDVVPVIRLDHLTDEQRRAYNIAHNKLTMNSDFNIELLQLELESLELDMTDFGFTEAEILELTVDDEEEASGRNLFVHDVNDAQHQDNHEGVEGSGESNEQYTYKPLEGSGLTKDELEEYASRAESIVTKRVILVYRTQEEENFLRSILNTEPEKELGVVYNVADLIDENGE